ncbi:MAG: S-adenosylmethionine:tRNA ribosyltransferase-isomerase, partial [Desulfobacteraceae bacterium]|nr:S-adenosylmethionine:tRNA ribosyltransferase-isomerase [Desulfobacteraceae bacterium]
MYSLKSYNFDLPQERIAQSPMERRDESKLLLLK